MSVLGFISYHSNLNDAFTKRYYVVVSNPAYDLKSVTNVLYCVLVIRYRSMLFCEPSRDRKKYW